MLGRALGQACRMALILALGALAGTALIRLAPGFGVDERELDPRLSPETIEALRRERGDEESLVVAWARHMLRLVRGDLGHSITLNRPVSALLAERAPVTFKSAGVGLGLAWIAAISLALPYSSRRRAAYETCTALATGALLSAPAAVVALVFLYMDGPLPAAIALVVFPKIFRYARNVLASAWSAPHVLTAFALGLGRTRVLARHVLPTAGPQAIALAGVSVSLAFGAAIPIEVICDSPGLGQLAWLAAQGRDLPLVVNLTLVVTLVTLTANAIADLVIATLGRREARA